jgi:predicted nucleotidyltransferase
VCDLLCQQLRASARRAFQGTSVVFAYLFGSIATRRAHAGSDVDVAVYLEQPDDPIESSLNLADRLSKESGVGQLDILVLNQAPLPVLARVIRERLVLYSRDEPARVRFESRSLREFFDFEIHARPLDDKFLHDIAAGRR